MYGIAVAQPPGYPGVGINTLDGSQLKAALEIRGTVKIDTMPPPTVPTRVLVTDQNDSIIHSMRIDSFAIYLGKLSTGYPDITGWGFGIFSTGVISYTSSFFRDSKDKVGVPSVNAVNVFSFESDESPVQERNVFLDWTTISNPSDFSIKGGVVSLGGYLYVSMKDDGLNERRVYRYDKNALSAGGIRMSFAGLLLANAGEAIMTSNGKDFYFSYNAGNAPDNTIAKYTVSGTNFVYVSSITLGAPGDFAQSFLVDSLENYYGLSAVFPTILKKFSSSGTPIRSHACSARYMMNWADHLYLARSFPESYFEKFNK